MAECTRLYRKLLFQINAKRIELGVPMSGERKTDGRKSLDNLAGTADGYFGKALYPDTPSGRRAGWAVLDEYVTALFGPDFEVIITGDAVIPSALGTKELDRRYLQSRHWRDRRFYKELGAKGGKATAAKHGRGHMQKISRRANRKRWKKVAERAKQITAVLDNASK